VTEVSTKHSFIGEMEQMKKQILKDILKICVFIALANLPFLTLTQILGMDMFLDTFSNADAYDYLKSDQFELNEFNNSYVVIQKTSHPDFSITGGDQLFYLKDEAGLLCRTVIQASNIDENRRYYTITFDQEMKEIVFEHQIVGKIVSIVEDNLWNSLSLQIWDVTINNLNAAALFTDD
jgi:hypothetical protein